MLSIFSHTSDSYAQAIQNTLGKGAQHARLVYREWFQTGQITGKDPHFNNAQALLKEICSLTDFSHLSLMSQGHEFETIKYLLQADDGMVVEMVSLPMKAGYTLCVSSQVGCRMGCAFCETGKMGLLRSLSAKEIVSQVFQAIHGLNIDVRNLVFMGMGEPLDNFEEVMQAVRILTDAHGLAIGPSRITISTSGVVNKIYRFMDEANPAVRLAVSINGSNDHIRNRLMPINRMYNMGKLKEVMLEYCARFDRKILIEYILIKGKTDSLEDADALAAYLEGLKVTVNLIPYNPQSRGCFQPAEQVDIDAFLERMRKKGYLTFIRSTKGQKIMAACGQLGKRYKKKSLAFSE